jgi:hypothetical protein
MAQICKGTPAVESSRTGHPLGLKTNPSVRARNTDIVAAAQAAVGSGRILRSFFQNYLLNFRPEPTAAAA